MPRSETGDQPHGGDSSGGQTLHLSHTSLAGTTLGFLNQGTMTLWNKKLHWNGKLLKGCSVHCRMFVSISDLYLLESSWQPPIPTMVVTAKMFPAMANVP